jgi:hypothetical protein
MRVAHPSSTAIAYISFTWRYQEAGWAAVNNAGVGFCNTVVLAAVPTFGLATSSFRV